MLKIGPANARAGLVKQSLKSCVGWEGGDCEVDGAAGGGGVAFGPNTSALRFYDAFGDVEAEASMIIYARLYKAFENGFPHVGGDSFARIEQR